MINITDDIKTAWKSKKQYCRLHFEPVAGNSFDLDASNLFGIAFSRKSVGGNAIEMGSACCGELEIQIYNDGAYADTKFEGAYVTLQIGVKDSDDVINYITIGRYTVDGQPRMLDTITLSALDNMVLFDKDVDENALSSIWATCTIESLVGWCCSSCGVTLNTLLSNMPNYDYHPTVMPTGITYRQLILWCMEIMNRHAYMDATGAMVVDKYHTSVDENINGSVCFSSDVYENAITVTGVKAVIDDTEYSYGSEGYVLKIEGNELIQDSSVLANMDIVGMTYTPFTLNTLPLPYLQPLDRISLTQGTRTVSTVITGIAFSLNSYCSVESVGETNVSQGYATLNPFTQRERQIIERAKSEITRQTNARINDLVYMNDLAANAMGMWVTRESSNGGTITYWHDAPTLSGSKFVVKMGSTGFFWTDNYNAASPVWDNSITAGGNAFFKFISAIGLTLADQNKNIHTDILPDSFSIYKENGQSQTSIMKMYGSDENSEVVMAIPKIIIDNPSTLEKDGYIEIGNIRIAPSSNGANIIFVG